MGKVNVYCVLKKKANITSNLQTSILFLLLCHYVCLFFFLIWKMMQEASFLRILFDFMTLLKVSRA
jgi:hypothetical protein